MKLPLENILLIYDLLPLELRVELVFGINMCSVKQVVDEFQAYQKTQEVSFYIEYESLNTIYWIYGIVEFRTDLLKFLLRNQVEPPLGVWDNAAFVGNLEAIELLHSRGIEGCTSSCMDWAAGMDQLPVVKFLHETRKEGCTTSAMDLAALSGCLETLEYLYNNRNEGFSVAALEFAASKGNLLIIKWLIQRRDFEQAEYYDALLMSEVFERAEVTKYLNEIINRMRQQTFI